jgi:histidinol-phosphate aminotransferase
MKTIAKETLFKVQPYIPGRPIEEVQREYGLKSVIKLASNENPYRPSPNVLKAMQKAIRNVNRYPDSGGYYLREALAKRLKVANGEFIFTNGSDELITLPVRAFVREGDEVVMAMPSFLIYTIASQIAGAIIRAVPLKNFRYDLAAMKQAITPKTKIVFLGNPDNPAGDYFTQKEIETFLDGLRKDLLIFIDEAYHEYVTAEDYVDSIGLTKRYPNIIVARTFSKMYGLAGLRIGYGVANAELIGILERLREPFNVNSVAQAAALACLKDQKYYKCIAKKFMVQREAVYKALESMGCGFIRTSTNFIPVHVKNGTDVTAALVKKGVIVRDMTAWGMKEYIRVTIGTETENKRFLKTLKEVLGKGRA